MRFLVILVMFHFCTSINLYLNPNPNLLISLSILCCLECNRKHTELSSRSSVCIGVYRRETGIKMMIVMINDSYRVSFEKTVDAAEGNSDVQNHKWVTYELYAAKSSSSLTIVRKKSPQINNHG